MCKKLVDFVVNNFSKDENRGHFLIFGDYEVEKDKLLIPIFKNITMKKVEDETGIEMDWKPDTINDYGRKMTCFDAILDIYGKLTRKDTETNFYYVEENLQVLANQYTEVENMIKCDNGIQIPKYRYCYIEGNWELFYATNQFAYYGKNGDIEMIRINDWTSVAGAEFAEIGLRSSVDALQTGEEILLYKANVMPSYIPVWCFAEDCNSTKVDSDNLFSHFDSLPEELPFR